MARNVFPLFGPFVLVVLIRLGVTLASILEIPRSGAGSPWTVTSYFSPLIFKVVPASAAGGRDTPPNVAFTGFHTPWNSLIAAWVSASAVFALSALSPLVQPMAARKTADAINKIMIFFTLLVARFSTLHFCASSQFLPCDPPFECNPEQTGPDTGCNRDSLSPHRFLPLS